MFDVIKLLAMLVIWSLAIKRTVYITLFGTAEVMSSWYRYSFPKDVNSRPNVLYTVCLKVPTI